MAEDTSATNSSYSSELEKVIEDNRESLLEKSGVLAVEAGYLFSNGWITSTEAIVVKVQRKLPLSEIDPDDIIPRRLGGFRVDVVPADPVQQLALLNEEDLTSLGLADVEPAALNLKYKPIPGNPIDRVFEISKPILCHASPDAGWPTLSKFLSGVKDQLTIAMYDFNADYIARDLILAAQSSGANVDLALDPKRNTAEKDIQTRIEGKLKENYTMTLAALGNGGLFDSAYHEKVIVRDSSSFWLSSGNFSVSSQPNIDPFGPHPPSGNIYGLGNRDWHVVVNDAELAKVFERYIKHDIEASSGGAAPSDIEFPDLLIPQDVFSDIVMVTAETPPPVAPRALPTPDELPVKVQPLLTPDNYIGHIQELVKKAEKSLYLQLQYIHPSNLPEDKEFAKLIRLVSDKTNQAGFDARIIIGNREARQWVRIMEREWDFDSSKIRVQLRVHNKGIIVDGKIVVVGSHNWSGDGTLRNRDASLIIHNSQIAQYYQKIFLNDWKFLAASDIQEDFTPAIAMAGEPTPPGMVRIPWSDYYDE